MPFLAIMRSNQRMLNVDADRKLTTWSILDRRQQHPSSERKSSTGPPSPTLAKNALTSSLLMRDLDRMNAPP
jgi:hypothetical protein